MNVRGLSAEAVLAETKRLVSERGLERDYPSDCPLFQPTIQMIVLIHQQVRTVAGVEASFGSILARLRQSSETARMADDTEPLARIVIEAMRNVLAGQ